MKHTGYIWIFTQKTK